METEAVISLQVGGWGRGVKCEGKMFDAVLRLH